MRITTWREGGQRLLRSAGVPGLVALGLGLAVAWGWGIWLPALQAELVDAQDQVAQLRQRLKAGVDPARHADVHQADGAEATWQALWASLPTAADAMHRQGALLSAATSQGLSIESVQYRGSATQALPGLWRQQVSLPLEAPYPAIRAWLGWVLQQPALSVDALDIARTDPMSEAVKARVQLSLWWRTGDVPAGAR